MKQPEVLSDRLYYLTRRYRRAKRVSRGFMDVASVIDVVLLLFLFMLCNSPFILQPGISLELPASEFVDGATYGSIVVTLSQEGLLFCNDERTTMEGLEAAFAKAMHQGESQTLLIEADARVRYESLVNIYNLARKVGIEDVVLANRLHARQGMLP